MLTSPLGILLWPEASGTDIFVPLAGAADCGAPRLTPRSDEHSKMSIIIFSRDCSC